MFYFVRMACRFGTISSVCITHISSLFNRESGNYTILIIYLKYDTPGNILQRNESCWNL